MGENDNVMHRHEFWTLSQDEFLIFWPVLTDGMMLICTFFSALARQHSNGSVSA